METEKAEQEKEVKINPNPIVETTSIIDKADATATRMEIANKKAEETLIRLEAIAARMMLGGRAEAGQVNKTPEQTATEATDARVAIALKKYK